MNKKSLLIFCPLLAISLTSCNEVVHYKDNPKAYEETMTYRDGFHVLQLTDIHWSINTSVTTSKQYLTKMFEEVNKKCEGKLDLIEITGDAFMLANKKHVKDFIKFMEEISDKYGCKYTLTWGNHDRQGTYNVKWMTKQFREAPHCIYLEQEAADDVYERGNFVINLKEGNVTKWQIANIDSGAQYSTSPTQFFRDYDYIRDEQYDWLKFMNDRVNNPATIAYYHIPQKDNQIAWDNIHENKESHYNKFFKLEGFAECGNEDVGGVFVDEVQKRNINVKGCFMGHAHNVDWTVDYKGVSVGLGVKTGKELYFAHIDANDKDPYVQEGLASVGINESFDLVGASLVTLHDDENFDLDHLYFNERDGGDFVKWVRY